MTRSDPTRPRYGEFPKARTPGQIPLTIRAARGARRAFWKLGAVYLWHGRRVRVRKVWRDRVYLALDHGTSILVQQPQGSIQ